MGLRVGAIYPSALALLLFLACDSGTVISERCFVDLAPISVRTKVLGVGDTVTFQASLGPAECLPAEAVSEDWRWSSTDSLVARIDSLSGLAEGVSPGNVLVQVQHARAPSVTSTTGLQVVAQ